MRSAVTSEFHRAGPSEMRFAVLPKFHGAGGAGKGYGLFKQPVFLVSVILLGVTLVLSSTVEFREKIPIKMSLDQFPLKVGEWSADRRLPIAQMFLDALDLSEYVMVDYSNGTGQSVNFYVRYTVSVG